MTATQRKCIFGLAKGLNMTNDNIHDLVFGITGQESLTAVTEKQANKVIAELKNRMRGCENITSSRSNKKYQETQPGMITHDQQRKAWALLYELIEYDAVPSKASVGERMAGILKRELGVTAVAGDNLFRWVDYKGGFLLIERLKKYVVSAEKKARQLNEA